MIYCNLHENQKQKILALADEDVLGNVYEDKTGFLNLKDYVNFYKKESISLDRLDELLKNLKNEQVYSINAVGKNSVKLVKKHFSCSEKTVQKIPHVQIYKF